MRSGPTRPAWAVLVVMAVILACSAPATWAGPVTVGQPLSKPVEPAGKELEPALQKIREGRHDEALGLIREQVAKHPDWPPAQLILARLLMASGQVVPGRRALERAAIEAPKHPDVFISLGTVALGDGRLSDAQLNFQRARELIAAGHWTDEQTKLFPREALDGLAAVAERREEWKTAQEHLNAWLELDPKNGQARQRLGAVLFRLDKIDAAFEALKQAAQDTPALEPAAVVMARLCTQKGDTKKAEEWFDYALKLEPSNARVHIAHGSWLLDQGRAPLARPVADEAVKLDPKSPEAQRLKGFIAWHLRDLTGAEAIFEALHRDLPGDGGSANLLALCLVEQDDPVKRARGLQLAEANARQNPRANDILTTLGWARYRSGQLDQAEQVLVALAQGQGGRITPELAYYLARVQADKGRNSDARRLLQSAIDLPGPFAHREEARAFLKTMTK
jgi:Tfp pilus assembly protein PilF